MIKLTETESRIMITRDWVEEGMGKYSWTRSFSLKWIFGEADGGDSCTTKPLEKNIMVNFMLCIFTTNLRSSSLMTVCCYKPPAQVFNALPWEGYEGRFLAEG